MYEVYDVVINGRCMDISHGHKTRVAIRLAPPKFMSNSQALEQALNYLHEKFNRTAISVVFVQSSVDAFFRVVTVPRTDKPAEMSVGHNLLTSTADPQFVEDSGQRGTQIK